MNKVVLLIITCLFVACSANTTNTNSNTVKASPSPKPTLSDDEVKAKQEKETSEQKQAVDDFIAKNYKGWQLQGVSGGYDNKCSEFSPCDLHLIKGKQTKIITVILKEFTRPDSTTYWFVYEARQIDLAQAKIEEIKEDEKAAVLENLTIDDISDGLRLEIYELERDAIASSQDYADAY